MLKNKNKQLKGERTLPDHRSATKVDAPAPEPEPELAQKREPTGSRFSLPLTMLKNAILSIIFLSSFTLFSCGNENSKSDKEEVVSEKEEVPSTIYVENLSEGFSWMPGTWVLVGGDEQIFEVWFDLVDSLRGVTYTRVDGTPVVTEAMTLVNKDGVTFFKAAPVDQNQGEYISFSLTDTMPGKARFENAEHDFPKWIEYFRTSDTTLHVEIGGDPEHETLRWDYIME